MPKKTNSNIIVGLDIGTTKIAALVGEINHDNEIEIIGVGTHPSKGLKRGVVINIEATVNSIHRAIETASLMAGCDISSTYTGISGSHIKSLNSHGIVAIHDQEVTQADIDRVIDAAKAVAIPADQKILHILPQEFIIDNQDGIHEPIGMYGVRLETKVHIVTGSVSAAQNIVKCVENCGLKVSDIILQQLASSYAVLSEDEKELGVCMVDIGGGTTDIAIFTDGAIRHTSVIPIAGDQVTNDIAIALRTPTKYAEEIKIQHGCAMRHLADPTINIEVPGVSQQLPKSLTKQALADVIEARYDELFTLVAAELRRSGFEDSVAAGGIVLTGGAAQIPGTLQLAEQIFQMPVRVGVPQQVKGAQEIINNSSYATSVGLLLAGFHRQKDQSGGDAKFKDEIASLWRRMKSWFKGNF